MLYEIFIQIHRHCIMVMLHLAHAQHTFELLLYEAVQQQLISL
jgi:hypothetical protein